MRMCLQPMESLSALSPLTKMIDPVVAEDNTNILSHRHPWLVCFTALWSLYRCPPQWCDGWRQDAAIAKLIANWK